MGRWGLVLWCFPLLVVNDKRQFLHSGPGSVRYILSGRMLRLDIRVCQSISEIYQSISETMLTNNVLRSIFLLVDVVLKV